MDCRCGHSFCWLCLLPLSEHCGCPQFGGRRTAEAKARLSSPGWRRAVLLSSEAASLRLLAFGLIVGVVLHRSSDVATLVSAAYAWVVARPATTKLGALQAAVGLLQLTSARAAMRPMPRPIQLHMAIRQVDLSFGGAGKAMYSTTPLAPAGCLPNPPNPLPPGATRLSLPQAPKSSSRRPTSSNASIC